MCKYQTNTYFIMELSLFNLENSYEIISLDESLCIDSPLHHCAHCAIYSPHAFPLFETYECKAYISMQMRFDGRLGFPGGEIKEKNPNTHNIIDGLNRELVEETNLDTKYFVTKEDYSFTYRYKEDNKFFHFFSKKVSVEEFLQIEENSLKAEDFGKEVLGFLRVPLFTMSDNMKGFPTFLKNEFAGCAKSQLLYLLLNKKLVSFDYVKESLSKVLT